MLNEYFEIKVWRFKSKNILKHPSSADIVSKSLEYLCLVTKISLGPLQYSYNSHSMHTPNWTEHAFRLSM